MTFTLWYIKYLFFILTLFYGGLFYGFMVLTKAL